jgi:hypothetical protein
VTAAKQSGKINRRYLEPVVVILDVTDVAQVGKVLLIMEMLLNLSEFCSSRSEVSALLAGDTKLFNGDFAATSATRCRFN